MSQSVLVAPLHFGPVLVTVCRCVYFQMSVLLWLSVVLVAKHIKKMVRYSFLTLLGASEKIIRYSSRNSFRIAFWCLLLKGLKKFMLIDVSVWEKNYKWSSYIKKKKLNPLWQRKYFYEACGFRFFGAMKN